MKKKILFLNPPDQNGGLYVRDTIYGCFTKSKARYVWPPLHLAQLSACCKLPDLEHHMIDAMGERLNPEDCHNRVTDIKPDYIVIVTSSASFESDRYIVRMIKLEVPDTKTIFIGTHVTLHPEESLKHDEVDYIIIGEPEKTITKLVKRLVLKKHLFNVDGIGYKQKDKLKIQGKSKRITDLNSLPTPNRELIPNGDYFNPLIKHYPYTTMISSRGCPYECSFCVAGIVYGKRFIARSPKSMIQEIQELQKKGIKEIFFRDEDFTIDRQRVLDFCNLLGENNIKIAWTCNAHINTLDILLLKVMANSGCRMIKTGVESGNDEILQRLNKGTTTHKIREVFSLMNRFKIDSVAHFMIGCPGDTKQTIRETILFSKEIKPTYVSFNIATPYEGTEMYNEYNTKEISMGDALTEGINTEAICGISEEDIKKFYVYAHTSFYSRPSYIFKRLLAQRSISELKRSIDAGLYLLREGLK